MSTEDELEMLRRRYHAAVRNAVDWLETHGRSQSWLAAQISVERSVLSRFLNPGDDAYTPHPDRPRMMTILEGIERVCLPASRDIFLSHSSHDKDLARKLAAELESLSDGHAPIGVWFDEAEIRPGQSIVAAVNRGLETSKFVGLLMTPDYFNSKSGWTDAEWHAVLHADPINRQGRLIPMLAGDCPVIPALLRHLLMIDIRGKKYKNGLTQLIRVLREAPLPRPVTVRGQLFPSASSVTRNALIAERKLPDADPDIVQEQLYCNLLPVERLPKQIFIAPLAKQFLRARRGGTIALPTKKALIAHLHLTQKELGIARPWTPSFRLHENTIITFHDLEAADSPLAAIVEDAGFDAFSTRAYLSSPEHRQLVLSLINMGISRHLTHPRRGLIIDPSPGATRFFFPDQDGDKRVFEWTPVRRKAFRTVAKPYMRNGKLTAWIHQACSIRAMSLASQFYVQLRPTRLLTYDGKRVKGGPDVGRIVTKWLAQERNIHVLYNVRFWTFILRSGRGPISIRLGDQWMEVSTVPAMVQQSYGIQGDSRNLLDLLDVKAQEISEWEDDLVAIGETLETDSDELLDDVDAPTDDADTEL